MDEKSIDAAAKSIYDRHRKYLTEEGQRPPGWNSLGASGRSHWRKVVKAVLKQNLEYQIALLGEKI